MELKSTDKGPVEGVVIESTAVQGILNVEYMNQSVFRFGKSLHVGY